MIRGVRVAAVVFRSTSVPSRETMTPLVLVLSMIGCSGIINRPGYGPIDTARSNYRDDPGAPVAELLRRALYHRGDRTHIDGFLMPEEAYSAERCDAGDAFECAPVADYFTGASLGELATRRRLLEASCARGVGSACYVRGFDGDDL